MSLYITLFDDEYANTSMGKVIVMAEEKKDSRGGCYHEILEPEPFRKNWSTVSKCFIKELPPEFQVLKPGYLTMESFYNIHMLLFQKEGLLNDPFVLSLKKKIYFNPPKTYEESYSKEYLEELFKSME